MDASVSMSHVRKQEGILRIRDIKSANRRAQSNLPAPARISMYPCNGVLPLRCRLSSCHFPYILQPSSEHTCKPQRERDEHRTERKTTKQERRRTPARLLSNPSSHPSFKALAPIRAIPKQTPAPTLLKTQKEDRNPPHT